MVSFGELTVRRHLPGQQAALERLCAARVPGDTHRNLSVRATFSNQRFKHILVPVWLMTYRYGTKTYQVVVNGVDGRIAGEEAARRLDRPGRVVRQPLFREQHRARSGAQLATQLRHVGADEAGDARLLQQQRGAP